MRRTLLFVLVIGVLVGACFPDPLPVPAPSPKLEIVRQQGVACGPLAEFVIAPATDTSLVQARERNSDGVVRIYDCAPGPGNTIWRCVGRHWTADYDGSTTVESRAENGSAEIVLAYRSPGWWGMQDCVSPPPQGDGGP